jgi:AcrR family transcriptional regulator
MPGFAPTNGPAAPEPSGRRQRGPVNPRRTFVAHSQHERILAATARAIAARGYEATTVQDICEEASISQEVFREHFKDTQTAAVAALEAAVDQMMEELRETFKAARSWPEAIWDTTAVTLECMVSEPTFAQLGLVGMLLAGEPGLDLLTSLMDMFAMFLKPGYELAPELESSHRLTDEAVANAVFGMLHKHIVREGPQTIPTLLPEMVRTILTPFLGAQAAEEFVAQRSARG